MTILPVPLTDFRADMAKYLNMLGNVEVHVTKHGRTIAVIRKPEDARKVEDPPGGERIRLMEALLDRDVEREPMVAFSTIAGIPVAVSDIAAEDTVTMVVVKDSGMWMAPPDGESYALGADPATGPDLTATTVYQKRNDGTVEAVDPAPFDPFDFLGGK